jgi:dTDP-4-amino-4,6-dideoxygalactose transaminase
MNYCVSEGVEAKIHYPIPIYRQQALTSLVKDLVFRETDYQARNIISFPCDQHLSDTEISEIVQTVGDFYREESDAS